MIEGDKRCGGPSRLFRDGISARDGPRAAVEHATCTSLVKSREGSDRYERVQRLAAVGLGAGRADGADAFSKGAADGKLHFWFGPQRSWRISDAGFEEVVEESPTTSKRFST